MHIIQYQDMEPEKVQMEGAEKVTVRWMISEKEGAENFAMRLFEIEPGGQTPLHVHKNEHEVYILNGQGAVWQNGRDVSVLPGTAVFVPPEEKHCFKNTGEDIFRFLCVIPV